MDLKKLAHELVFSKPNILFYYREGKGYPKKDGRPGRGKPTGLVLAYKEGDKIYVSYSKAHPNDEFDRYKGVLRAYSKNRAVPLGADCLTPAMKNIPHDILPLLNKLIDVLDKKVTFGVWKLN